MVKIFIIYGKAEGLGYAKKINEHFKKNNLDSFLAARGSPDMTLGKDYQPQINEKLINADVVIIVMTSELKHSVAAMDEINQVQNLNIPFIPYERKDSERPEELMNTQTIEFDPGHFDEPELKELELNMWRLLDTSKIKSKKILETETDSLKPMEVPYIG